MGDDKQDPQWGIGFIFTFARCYKLWRYCILHCMLCALYLDHLLARPVILQLNGTTKSVHKYNFKFYLLK